MVDIFKTIVQSLKKKKPYLMVLFLIAAISILAVRISAQEEILGIITEPEIKLYLGDTKVFTTYKPNRVVIGNPEVADVIDAMEDSITLVTKSPGNTTFVYWDIFGEHFYRIKVLPENISDIKKRIDNLLRELRLPKVYTQQNEEEGKVLLLGQVPSEKDKERIDITLGELKAKTIDIIQIKEEEGVVEISVKVLELDRDATKTLGFEPPGAFTGTETGAAITSSGTASEGLRAFFTFGGWTRTAFTTTLNLLIQEGKARVLSEPTLACLSGKEAELLVGGEKPIFTTTITTAGSSTNVEYKEYGIKLNIVPTIADKNRIHVSLNVEVSEVGTAETIGEASAPTAKAYPLTKRNVITELYLDNNQTLVIGGLIKEKDEEDIRKIAGLGDIPIIGALFRKKTITSGGGQGERGNIELFVTLTPRIVTRTSQSSSRQAYEIQDLPIKSASITMEGASSEAIKEYVRSVLVKIVNSAYYPEDARRLGYEGIVRLNIYLNPDGSLKHAQITQSSGYSLLDEAALDTVSNQAPFLPFPDNVTVEELKVQIPIAYLRDQ